MSFCDKCSSKVKILKSFKFDNQYIGGSAYKGKRPEVVIESVQIKAQGNLGTTRSCTIKFIAFTQEQADELAACYCVPSMSVRVQFGWNRGANGDPVPGPTEDKLTDNRAVCKINNTRNSYVNYDGLQGMVGKYSMTFNKDNMWWELTLDVTASSTPVMARPFY